MTTQMLGTSTRPAVAARVNLLPPEIAAKAAARRSQVAMVLTGVAAVGVVGVLYAHQSARVASAQQAKQDAVAQSVKLRSDLDNLQSVANTIAQVDAANTTLTQAMQREVLWSRYLHDMTLTIPDDVWLTTYDANMQPAQSPPTGTVLDPGLGSITISGYAMEHVDLASWLESLAKERGYTNPYFTEAKKVAYTDPDTGLVMTVVRFTSQVNLGPNSLSKRYAKGLDR